MTRFFSRASLCLFLSLLLVTTGCSDDDPVTPPQSGTGVVRITVDETTLGPGGNLAYIFTSALDGTVLDTATWTEPTVLELAIPKTLGEAFQVTQVSDHRFLQAYLQTSRHEVAGENRIDMTRSTFPAADSYGDLDFSNIPPHFQHTLDSGNILVSGGRLPESTRVPMMVEPSDILLTLEGFGKPRTFQWIPDVMFESLHEVDLSNLEQMSALSIRLPGSAAGLRCSLRGFKPGPDGSTRLVYGLDNATLSPPLPAIWEPLSVPRGFAGFEVSCQQNRSTDPMEIVLGVTEGGIPGAVSLWDLTIDIVDPEPDGCVVETSGQVDELDLIWTQGAGPLFAWELRTPGTDQQVILPRLPEDLEALVPDLDREAFVLDHALARREVEGTAGDGVTPMITRDQVVQFR